MLAITDLSVRLAGRLLIDQSSVQITPGSRVGLVGRNGTGKSTLFKVIRSELAAEHGSVTLPPRWRRPPPPLTGMAAGTVAAAGMAAAGTAAGVVDRASMPAAPSPTAMAAAMSAGWSRPHGDPAGG